MCLEPCRASTSEGGPLVQRFTPSKTTENPRVGGSIPALGRHPLRFVFPLGKAEVDHPVAHTNCRISVYRHWPKHRMPPSPGTGSVLVMFPPGRYLLFRGPAPALQLIRQ